MLAVYATRAIASDTLEFIAHLTSTLLASACGNQNISTRLIKFLSAVCILQCILLLPFFIGNSNCYLKSQFAQYAHCVYQDCHRKNWYTANVILDAKVCMLMIEAANISD